MSEPFSGLPPYEGREYRCVPAGRDEAAEVADILRRTSMQGWVRTVFAPGPDAARDPFRREQLTVCIRQRSGKGVCVAVYALHRFLVQYAGRGQEAVYLGLLRVLPEYRGSRGIFRDGFSAIPHFVRHLGWPERYFTSIAVDNLPARRLLEAGLRSLPRYTPLGELHTLIFSCALGRGSHLLTRADAAQWPEVVAFYNRMMRDVPYAPVLGEAFLREGTGLAVEDFHILRREGRVAGCLALWDRRTSRRILVEGYRPPLHALRPAVNLWARLCGRPSLPAPGHALEMGYAAFLAVEPEFHSLAGGMLREALFLARRHYGLRGLLLGLAPHGSLWPVLSRLPHTAYTTCIEHVAWPHGEAVPASCVPVQPEIALL